jgi:hypothetical protein
VAGWRLKPRKAYHGGDAVHAGQFSAPENRGACPMPRAFAHGQTTIRSIAFLIAGGVSLVASANAAPLMITDQVSDGAYRFLGQSKSQDFTGAIIEGVTATNLRRGFIRITVGSGVTIRNVEASLAAPTIPPELPHGIAVEGGSDVLIEDAVMRNFQMVPGSMSYLNGDGFTSERAATRVTFRRATAIDNSDGGFDLKSTGTRLEDTTAIRNGRNYRFWGEATTGTITSVDPRSAHVWAGNGAVVVIDKLVARSTTNKAIIWLDDATSITIKACELDVPPGTPMVVDQGSGTAVTLGPGCNLPS